MLAPKINGAPMHAVDRVDNTRVRQMLTMLLGLNNGYHLGKIYSTATTASG